MKTIPLANEAIGIAKTKTQKICRLEKQLVSPF